SSRARARSELGGFRWPGASAHRPGLVRGSKTGDRRRTLGGEGGSRNARPRDAGATGASVGAAEETRTVPDGRVSGVLHARQIRKILRTADLRNSWVQGWQVSPPE